MNMRTTATPYQGSMLTRMLVALLAGLSIAGCQRADVGMAGAASGRVGVDGTPSVASVDARTLPPPVRLHLADLSHGTCDGRQIEIAGTIAAADVWSGQLRIELTEEAHRIEIRVQEYPLLKPQALAGARILARGVCTPSPKNEAKIADLRLLVPRFSELTLDAATLAAIERPGELPVL